MGQPSGDTRWIVEGAGSGVPLASGRVLLGRPDEILRSGGTPEPSCERKLCGRSGTGGEFAIAQWKFPSGGVERGRDVCGGGFHANKILESWDSRNTIFSGRRHSVWTVQLRIQRPRRQSTDLAGMEFLGRGLGRTGELCTGITRFGRRMESSDVVGPACGRGWECAGSLGGGGLCGAWLGGVERVEIIDGAHGGNVRDRAGVGIRGVTGTASNWDGWRTERSD